MSQSITPFSATLSERRWRRLAVRIALRRLLPARRRRFYCIGLPKSGTHSIEALYSRALRSRHEPFPRFLIENLSIAATEDPALQARLIRELRLRDRALYLDLESSHLLGPYCPLLARAFPAARFLVPVRAPGQWLPSMINDDLNLRGYKHYALWRGACAIYFGGEGQTHPAVEQPLAAAGLFTLDGYLQHWRRFHLGLLDAIESGKLEAGRVLIFRIDQLRDTLPRLAAFAGVAASDLDDRQLVRYRTPHDHRILDALPRDYVAERVDRLCGPVWQRIVRDTESVSFPHQPSLDRNP